MSKLFFSLRGVPIDEAEDIREILFNHEIDFYETSAGNWGISMPALWLKNENDWDKASELLNEYQLNRTKKQRALYEHLKKQGQHRRLFDVICENPLQFLLYIGFSIFIFYISIKLVFEFGFNN